jgi:hypothetical protein
LVHLGKGKAEVILKRDVTEYRLFESASVTRYRPGGLPSILYTTVNEFGPVLLLRTSIFVLITSRSPFSSRIAKRNMVPTGKFVVPLTLSCVDPIILNAASVLKSLMGYGSNTYYQKVGKESQLVIVERKWLER